MYGFHQPVETIGGWHEQTVGQLRRLGSALARQTGQEESEANRHDGLIILYFRVNIYPVIFNVLK